MDSTLIGSVLIAWVIGAIVGIALYAALHTAPTCPTCPICDTAVPCPVCPTGLQEGDTFWCLGRPEVYKFVGGQKRWYTTLDVYKKYGNPAKRTVTCDVVDAIPSGPDMA